MLLNTYSIFGFQCLPVHLLKVCPKCHNIPRFYKIILGLKFQNVDNLEICSQSFEMKTKKQENFMLILNGLISLKKSQKANDGRTTIADT